MAGEGLLHAVAEALSRHTGKEVIIHSCRGVGGGCINLTECLETSAGRFFLKSNPGPMPNMFQREAEGLAALARVGVIDTPHPIHASGGGADHPPFLVMTWIKQGRRGAGFSEDFGRRFARLHRLGTGVRFGFDHDNYIGSTTQPNGWMENWTEFFRERRLGHQLGLAAEHGSELRKLGDRLLARLGEFLDDPEERPTILHGNHGWHGRGFCGVSTACDGNSVGFVSSVVALPLMEGFGGFLNRITTTEITDSTEGVFGGESSM